MVVITKGKCPSFNLKSICNGFFLKYLHGASPAFFPPYKNSSIPAHEGDSNPLVYKLWELVKVILPAGCYAFGGPTAHLAVFHDLFVTKLHWLKDQVSEHLLIIWWWGNFFLYLRKKEYLSTDTFFPLILLLFLHAGICRPVGFGHDPSGPHQL